MESSAYVYVHMLVGIIGIAWIVETEEERRERMTDEEGVDTRTQILS